MLELSNGDARLVVLPDNGGRLASLSVGDLELLRTAADDPGQQRLFDALVRRAGG